MSQNGKFVRCIVGHEDGEPIIHEVSRSICLLGLRPGCEGCENSNFSVRVQLRVVDQQVACPRWENEEARKEKKDPVDYVPVLRDACINEKPFQQCVTCPNSNPTELPRRQPRWFEQEERKKKIELELDEEERG